MKCTIGEIIEILSRFDDNLKIENELVLTWHHDAKVVDICDDILDIDKEAFDTADKIWLFNADGFDSFLDWHEVAVKDLRDKNDD